MQSLTVSPKYKQSSKSILLEARPFLVSCLKRNCLNLRHGRLTIRRRTSLCLVNQFTSGQQPQEHQTLHLLAKVPFLVLLQQLGPNNWRYRHLRLLLLLLLLIQQQSQPFGCRPKTSGGIKKNTYS